MVSLVKITSCLILNRECLRLTSPALRDCVGSEDQIVPSAGASSPHYTWAGQKHSRTAGLWDNLGSVATAKLPSAVTGGSQPQIQLL